MRRDWSCGPTSPLSSTCYEGATWVAYDRQFRREMLARKDLNWSVPNSRLYNEAFTGRTKIMQRCQYCLSEVHGSTGCQQHPNPMIVGWFHPPVSTSTKAPGAEVCRNFNAGHCRFVHSCSDCAGPHSSLNCPRRMAAPQGPLRNRPSKKGPRPAATLGGLAASSICIPHHPNTWGPRRRRPAWHSQRTVSPTVRGAVLWSM